MNAIFGHSSPRFLHTRQIRHCHTICHKTLPNLPILTKMFHTPLILPRQALLQIQQAFLYHHSQAEQQRELALPRPGSRQSCLKRAHSSPEGLTPRKRVKFANVQNVLLPAGYSQFVLKNPESTSQGANRVYKECEDESVGSVKSQLKKVISSPRLEAPNGQKELLEEKLSKYDI